MDVTNWIIWLLVSVTVTVSSSQAADVTCPDLQPPHNGVLKCQTLDSNLQCTATCLEGQVFAGGEKVMHRTCVTGSDTWLQGASYLPPCVPLCNSSLIDKADPSHLSVSSTLLTPSKAASTYGAEASTLSSPGTWRPAVDNILQYIQVDLGSPHTVQAWRIRGDGRDSYVRLCRLLFSKDGVSWTPYSDGRVMDKFLTGNFDSGTEVTEALSSPQVARYVRLNPLSWHRHIAVDWELLGCPYPGGETTDSPGTGVPGENACKLPQPPEHGAVNCERNGTHVRCTAYCLNNRVFPDLGPALDLTCDSSVGQFTHTPLPGCVERDTTVPPLNISGPCMQEEGDCGGGTANGDYQYCGDCHYFSTCSHGYFFLRPCPEQLQFDSRQGRCDYHSATCDSKRLSVMKAMARRSRQPGRAAHYFLLLLSGNGEK